MLPLVPTLLLNPNPKTLDRLLELVNRISCSRDDSDIKNYFLENYIHYNKSKIEKKRGKLSESEKITLNVQQKMEKQPRLSPEQIFLLKAIQRKESWEEIAYKLNLQSKMFGIKRMQWNYYSFLIFLFLEKLQGTLGYFIGIKLMNRTWSTTQLTFKSIQNSNYFRLKFQEVMKRDVKSIQKIEFAFLRDLILSIKFEENIEASLKRINYANYVELKSKNSIDPVCIAEDWINFLCKKIDDNKVHQRPSLKYQKRRFILRWVKLKIITPSTKENFQHKLSFLLNQKQQLTEIVINEIELILIQAIREKKNWLKVQQEIQKLKNKMNFIEKKSIKDYQNVSQSQRSSRSSSRKKKGKDCMQDSLQYISISSGKMNCSHQLIQGDFQPDVSKFSPQKLNFFQDLPIKTSNSSKKQTKSSYKNKKILQKNRSQSNPKKKSQVQSEIHNFQQIQKTKQQTQLFLSGDQQLILFLSSRLIKNLQLIRKDYFPGILEKQLAEYYEKNTQSLKQKSNNILNLIYKNPNMLIQREQNLKTVVSMELAAKNFQFIKRSIKSERKKVCKTQTTQEIQAQMKISFDKQCKQLYQQIRGKQKLKFRKQIVKNDD